PPSSSCLSSSCRRPPPPPPPPPPSTLACHPRSLQGCLGSPPQRWSSPVTLPETRSSRVCPGPSLLCVTTRALLGRLVVVPGFVASSTDPHPPEAAPTAGVYTVCLRRAFTRFR
ncbi:unnamed protein product, partial [Ectocarpus sp. 8 AP-2014]